MTKQSKLKSLFTVLLLAVTTNAEVCDKKAMLVGQTALLILDFMQQMA
ncbi:hypothetical protein ACQKMD_04840 [Viridibacillus sp. NPDC096237]